MARALRIRRDDQVRVISGKDRGKTGKVLRVDIKKNKVFIEGMNLQKRHRAPRTLRDTQRQQEVAGGVIEREGPIHISNVQLIDPKSSDPTRVGIERVDGKRIRVARRNGNHID